jgi:acetoin utilization protein AcuC
MVLLKQGKRVAYIDIDAHHGDGVQSGFYDTDKVLTISLHESGEFLFPGTGSVEEIGEGEGKGYSVNLPFYPGTGDDVFVRGFDEIVPPLIEAYKPDVIVTQLGVDTMASDPLAHLNLTTDGFCRMIERFRSFGIPWVALGGGGYDVSATARSWALAFGIMCGIEIPDEIPVDCLNNLKQYGMEGTTLRDHERAIKEDSTTRKWAEANVKYIKENVFPFYGI